MLRQFFSFFMPRLHWHPCNGLDRRADTALAHWLLAPGPSFMLPFPATHWRKVRRRGLQVSLLEHESPASRQSLPARMASKRAVRQRCNKERWEDIKWLLGLAGRQNLKQHNLRGKKQRWNRWLMEHRKEIRNKESLQLVCHNCFNKCSCRCNFRFAVKQ